MELVKSEQLYYTVHIVYYSGIQCMYSVYTLYTVVYTVLYSGICGGEESIPFLGYTHFEPHTLTS